MAKHYGYDHSKFKCHCFSDAGQPYLQIQQYLTNQHTLMNKDARKPLLLIFFSLLQM